MKILLVNTGHPRTIKGGAEAAVLDLAHRMVSRGHSVALVVHHGGRELETSEEDGLRIYALPYRNLYFGFDDAPRRNAALRFAWHAVDSVNPWMAAAFGRILDRERPDVVNTHVVAGLSPLIWREAKRRGLPVVHYLHEYKLMCPRGTTFRDGRLCAKPCASCGVLAAPRKRLTGLVDSVIGVSHFTLQRHLDWGFFPNARRAVVPNIFEDLAVRSTPRPQGGPLRLGYFGRLIEDKGAHVLVDAVRRLPDQGWTLDVAGTGDEAYLARLREAAPERVRFVGWTKAEAFFPTIDVLVLPSVWPDPQPRVTFEAFMHGLPVVGARAGGIAEEIDEGVTGWLFEAGSADDLARVLRARLADRADLALPAANFSARLAGLNPETVAAQYEAVYSAAIAGLKSPAGPLPSGSGRLAEHIGNS
jgi:glycosyltransferase involved in cell wall biosynthesis